MTGGVAPGWYPDYEAPPGHQRYWDGARWTERRSGPPAATTSPATSGYGRWLLAAVVVLVAISSAVLVLGDRETGSTHSGSPPPPPASTSEPPAGEKTWEVAAAIDGTTVELTNGAEVRLAGITGSCSTGVLARLVVGHTVTLTRRGPDRDADGRLLRYMDRDGVDIGKTLIQQGWANASDEPNPRRAIYRRIDGRSPDICG